MRMHREDLLATLAEHGTTIEHIAGNRVEVAAPYYNTLTYEHGIDREWIDLTETAVMDWLGY